MKERFGIPQIAHSPAHEGDGYGEHHPVPHESAHTHEASDASGHAVLDTHTAPHLDVVEHHSDHHQHPKPARPPLERKAMTHTHVDRVVVSQDRATVSVSNEASLSKPRARFSEHTKDVVAGVGTIAATGFGVAAIPVAFGAGLTAGAVFGAVAGTWFAASFVSGFVIEATAGLGKKMREWGKKLAGLVGLGGGKSGHDAHGHDHGHGHH